MNQNPEIPDTSITGGFQCPVCGAVTQINREQNPKAACAYCGASIPKLAEAIRERDRMLEERYRFERSGQTLLEIRRQDQDSELALRRMQMDENLEERRLQLKEEALRQQTELRKARMLAQEERRKLAVEARTEQRRLETEARKEQRKLETEAREAERKRRHELRIKRLPE